MRLQRWAGAFAAALGMTATARAQPPAAHDSSNVGVATPCRNPVERWAGAFDFVSQSLSAVDSANISASELLRLDQRIGGGGARSVRRVGRTRPARRYVRRSR